MTSSIKLLVTVVMFIAATVILQSMNPRVVTEELSQSGFYFHKLEAKELDLIIAGDSRTGNAINPETLASRLQVSSYLNFAFPAAVFNDEYIQAIDQRVKSGGFVVLGVTPLSLLLKNAEKSRYRKVVNESWATRLISLYFGHALDYFRSYPEEDTFYRGLIRGRWMEPPGRVVLHKNGWQEMRLKNAKMEQSQRVLSNYEGHVVYHVGRLVEAIELWSARGIQVSIFIPPVSAEFAKIEADASGFSRKTLQPLLDAGARWVPTENRYPTFDGTHLDGQAAQEFSSDFAQSLSPIL